MTAANYLLFILGLLGGADILLYHSISHGIRSHPDAKWELITHALRGPTYAALFLLVPNFEMRGIFAVGFILLLVFDVAISIWDFALERRSRDYFGGLPSGEYVLHMILAMVFGAFVASAFPVLLHWLHSSTALIYSTALAPQWLRIVFAFMAISVLYSGVKDLFASIALWKRPARSPSTD